MDVFYTVVDKCYFSFFLASRSSPHVAEQTKGTYRYYAQFPIFPLIFLNIAYWVSENKFALPD